MGCAQVIDSIPNIYLLLGLIPFNLSAWKQTRCPITPYHMFLLSLFSVYLGIVFQLPAQHHATGHAISPGHKFYLRIELTIGRTACHSIPVIPFSC